MAQVDNGDICALVGIEGFEIGDTVASPSNPEPLPRIAIDEPTMSMTFTINDSPFFGRDGKFVTSRHIGDRLTAELDRNLALRVVKDDNEDVAPSLAAACFTCRCLSKQCAARVTSFR